MKLSTIEQKLQNYKAGTFVNIEWDKDISNAKCKKSGLTVIKNCSGVVRTCINYSNLSKVKEIARLDNPSNHVKESWFEHYKKGIVQHKSDNSKKYLQVFTTNKHKIKSSYIVLYNETNKICNLNPSVEELYELGLINKSEISKSSDIITFTLSVDNILKFGGSM